MASPMPSIPSRMPLRFTEPPRGILPAGYFAGWFFSDVDESEDDDADDELDDLERCTGIAICSVLFINSSGFVILSSVLWRTWSGTSSSESEDDEDLLDLDVDKDDGVDLLVELGLAVVALLNVAAIS